MVWNSERLTQKCWSLSKIQLEPVDIKHPRCMVPNNPTYVISSSYTHHDFWGMFNIGGKGSDLDALISNHGPLALNLGHQEKRMFKRNYCMWMVNHVVLG